MSQSKSAPKGRSIINMIEDRIDQELAEVIALSESAPDTQRSEAIGRLQGMCHALAIIVSPYAPNPHAIAAEAEARAEGARS